MPEIDPYQFHGFDAPHYTQTPDQLFDELLAAGRLSDPALRVLLYLIRRTFGFKKISDQVSISQIVRGIVTKDGTRLDWGAGVCKASACKGTKELVAKGIICTQHNSSPARGDEATTYTLRMAGMPLAEPDPVSMARTGGVHQIDRGSLEPSPVSMIQIGGVHQIDRGSLEPDLPRVHGLNTQETVLQETESQDDSNQPAPQKKRPARRNGTDAPASATPAPAPIALRDDPAPALAQPGAPRDTATDRYSPYIAGVIFDHSRELGDAAHQSANSTQAHRLWAASGLGEDAFVALLHEARRLVREYQGKQGTGTIANRMGYYFRCLLRLCAAPDEWSDGGDTS